jgi:D-amino peptidase
MRVLIMSDMGVSGIVKWQQVTAAIRVRRRPPIVHRRDQWGGAAQGTAGCRVVVTARDTAGRSIHLCFTLDPACEWVAHHPWSRYTEMLEQGCDAVLLVGMHARAGTPDGVLCHTISSTSWRNLWFNDDLVGETGINAALCGHYGVPVALVTGDEATCREARDLMGDGLTTVAVKRGLTRFSARQIPPVRARQMIEEGAKQALRDLSAVRPYVPARPTTIRFELAAPDHVQQYMGRHGVEIADPLTVISRGADWLEAWDNFWGWDV